MISPWYVGALGADEGSVDSIYNNYLDPDIAYCKNNNMDYYPVVFSGFSWTLWQNGKPNMIARNAGQTFWNQAYRLKQRGLDAFYVAMFDEYDEGTAIAKNASDYFDIPTDQYFVTASCDGYWLSSDFQLRVVNEAIKMMKGQRSTVSKVPVAHSNGPIYYRNSFESKYVTCVDSQYNGNYPVDPCFKNNKVLSSSNASGNASIVKNNTAKTGDYLAAFSGNGNGNNSSYIYQISETAIKIKKGMKLSYSMYAVNNGGRNTYVDLLLDDGSYVSTKGFASNGVSMGASSTKGNVGSWSDYSFTFGSDSLAGKSIVGVALAYGGNAGNYSAYFDNIIIEDGEGQGVEEPTEPPVSTNVKLSINGYQISSTLEGFRTIYFIKDDDKEASEVGLIYGLTDRISESDMVVGSQNQYVTVAKATDEGKNPFKLSDDVNTTSYTMTMLYGDSGTGMLSSKISVRAYAKLNNGKYVYGDIKTMSIYSVANVLYQQKKMITYSGHNYLYEKILNVVTPGYTKVDYDWGNIIVKGK